MANDARHETPKEIPLKTPIRIYGGTKLKKSTDIVKYCQQMISMIYWKRRVVNEVYDTIDWEIFQMIKKLKIIKLLLIITLTKTRLRQ
jgi:hypothetical protein